MNSEAAAFDLWNVRWGANHEVQRQVVKADVRLHELKEANLVESFSNAFYSTGNFVNSRTEVCGNRRQ